MYVYVKLSKALGPSSPVSVRKIVKCVFKAPHNP